MLTRSGPAAAFVILLELCLSAGPLAADPKTGKLQGYDALTAPGKGATIKAKLERVMRVIGSLGINPDVEGESLNFFLMEQPITDPRYSVALETPKYVGKATTSGAGFAEIDFTPERSGVYKLEARVRDGSDYVALPAPLNVAAFSPEDRVAIVDLDETLTDISALKAAVTEDSAIKLREGAGDALFELADKRGFRLIYISSRDDSLINRTRGWIDAQRLPSGPIFFWDFWQKSWSDQTFKTNLIASLKKNLPGLTVGIGDSAAEANACLANGLTPHIIGTPRAADLSPLAI